MSAPVDVLSLLTVLTDAAPSPELRAELAEARAAVEWLLEVATFAELLKFKQSGKNANAAFLDYRDCIHLQTIARAALARCGAQP